MGSTGIKAENSVSSRMSAFLDLDLLLRLAPEKILTGREAMLLRVATLQTAANEAMDRERRGAGR